MLRKLNSDDLKYSGDNTITEIHLEDYDWMKYSMLLYIYVEDYGMLNIVFIYDGCTSSRMEVTVNNKLFVYQFDTSLYFAYQKKYLERHLMCLENKDETFFGGDILVEFFNAVFDNGTLME